VADPGGAGPLLFWQSQFIFFTLYTMSEKNIFEIEFGFYSVRNPRSFCKCGGCMRVCVNRNRGRYCFLFSKGPILNDIRGHSIPKIHARLQEIASNFSKISGGGPPDPPPALAPSGLRPLTAPFQNSWIRP